ADDMIYHVTHDLRAPLRALKALPEWIADDCASQGLNLPESVSENLDTIAAQATALDQMVLDLRDYSRVGRCADPDDVVAIEAVISEVLAELTPTPALKLEVQLEMPEIVAPANEIRLLLSTLLKNAVQHHDDNRANVTISSKLNTDTALICVTDDGPGIPPDMRDRAFAPMTTLYRREEGAGTGLGLTTARRIVSNLGGEILLSTPPTGRGLRVEVQLPAERALTCSTFKTKRTA
ncbi:MAG: HAMP domain-containing sensor histidine kinase, partial [Pseudomonadota bacterium]